jgi:hypothetical protein
VTAIESLPSNGRVSVSAGFTLLAFSRHAAMYQYYVYIQALSMPTATGRNMMWLSACSNVSALKMDAVHFSETSVNFCLTARRLISEDSKPHLCSQVHEYRHWTRDILQQCRMLPEADIESRTHRKVPRLSYFARHRTWDHETFRGRATFVAGRCPCASSTCVLLRWHKTIKFWDLEADAKHEDLALLMRDIFAWIC